MKRLLTLLTMVCVSGNALPCRVSPSNLYRDHVELIKEARVIVLAEAVASNEVRPNSCQFRSVRTLKGQAPIEFSIPCRSPISGERIADLSAHNAPPFWQQRMGRITFDTTCQLLTPAFIVGHKYLLLLDVEPDTKQFEEIGEQNDQWLLFVEQYLQRSAQ